jgi:hypothetical protein
MADKLDWQNKHLVLLRYITLKDVVEKENYKIRPDLAELFVGVNNATDMVFKFAEEGRWKCACELLAYIAHRRAAVWWGYKCVLSLIEELKVNPAEERDISEIGADFDVVVPDFAKVKPPEPDPEAIARAKAQLAQIEADSQKARSAVDPDLMAYVEEAVEVVWQIFKDTYGIHPMDLVKKLAKEGAQDFDRIDRNSPIFQEAAKLKTKLKTVQKETVDTIKSVLPPKVPEHEKKMQDNALAAVYRWVAAPDDPNSKVCLDAGNECPDTPAGLLALTAFWSFGNLMPGGEQVIATPPGMAANGLCQTLLLAALHKGGVRKVKERYEEYFRLGVEVLTGKDTWEESLASGKAPHEEDSAAAPAAEQEKPPKSGESSGQGSYKRWNPPSPGPGG